MSTSMSDIQGLAQGRVGIFLQLRTQLNEMSKSPVLTISDKATQLLVAQTSLEAQLSSAATQATSGTISDALSAVGFYALMEKQIYDVDDLWTQYQGLGSTAKPSLFPSWLWWIGGALVVFKFIKKGNR